MTHPRPTALDVALASALTLLLQLELWLGETYEGEPAFPGDRTATAVLLLGVTVPLAWRRVHPRAAFAASMLALSVLSLWQGGAEAGGLFLVLLIAVYSAAAWSDRPLEVAAIAAVTLIAHGLRNPWSDGLGDYLFAPAFCAAGFVLGRIVHARGRRAQQAEASAVEAVAAERARLARELHDVVAHSVSVMVMQAKGGAAVLDSDPDRARTAFRTIESSGRQAIEELRLMLGLLRGDETVDEAADRSPQPGLARLPALIESVRSDGLTVELHEEGEPARLPAGEDVSAYRIVQESLTNTLKHAGAQRASVTLRWNEDAVELEILDDGDGGNRLDVPSSGRGLIGMRERATMFGGTLTAGPRHEGGFRVHARLPRPR